MWNETTHSTRLTSAINKLYSYSIIVSKWSPSPIKATQLCFGAGLEHFFKTDHSALFPIFCTLKFEALWSVE